VLAVLFFLKAAALALFVTPLWDVPDEVGHFAYASDLADGRGIAPPGLAVISPEIAAHWPGHTGGPPIANWTEIHPPGYALAAAAALRVARTLTPDFERRVRLTRLTSALFGALTIFLLHDLLLLAGTGGPAALAGAGLVGCIPMFSHMASGVSHDTLSAALGAVCAIAWVRLVREPSWSAAAAVALALAAAGAVKGTIAPVALVLSLLLPWRVPGRIFARVAGSAALAIVALSTTAFWWAMRLGGIPTPPAARPRHGAAAFFDAVRDLPIADHTLKNFLGLIGWTSSGPVRWFQISGPFLAADAAVIAAVAALAAAWTWRNDFRGGTTARIPRAAAWSLAGAVFAASFAWLVSRPAVSPVKLLLESVLFALPFLAATPRPAATPEEIAVSTSRLAILGFSLAYFWNVARSYLLTGEMRGAHGRYFFVVLGFLLVGLYVPAVDFLRGWRGRNRALAAAVALVLVNEGAFYAIRVIPFYRGAPPGAAARVSP
jgi:hypothetical protein